MRRILSKIASTHLDYFGDNTLAYPIQQKGEKLLIVIFILSCTLNNIFSYSFLLSCFFMYIKQEGCLATSTIVILIVPLLSLISCMTKGHNYIVNSLNFLSRHLIKLFMLNHSIKRTKGQLTKGHKCTLNYCCFNFFHQVLYIKPLLIVFF